MKHMDNIYGTFMCFLELELQYHPLILQHHGWKSHICLERH